MNIPVCVNAPPEIRKRIEGIRTNASAGVPLHKQQEEALSIIRRYLEWRIGLTKQLANSKSGESKQGNTEADHGGAK
jgi:hypothetical protein